jgi:hypothetical protein
MLKSVAMRSISRVTLISSERSYRWPLTVSVKVSSVFIAICFGAGLGQLTAADPPMIDPYQSVMQTHSGLWDQLEEFLHKSNSPLEGVEFIVRHGVRIKVHYVVTDFSDVLEQRRENSTINS